MITSSLHFAHSTASGLFRACGLVWGQEIIAFGQINQCWIHLGSMHIHVEHTLCRQLFHSSPYQLFFFGFFVLLLFSTLVAGW